MSSIDCELMPAQKIDRIADEMSHLAGQLNAGTYRLLDLIADFEELGGCGNTGARSTAHYLTAYPGHRDHLFRSMVIGRFGSS